MMTELLDSSKNFDLSSRFMHGIIPQERSFQYKL